MVPEKLETWPPLMRPVMLLVSYAVSLRKFAMLLVAILNWPKLWNRLGPLPGLVPLVML
jgi:hypothetical protein